MTLISTTPDLQAKRLTVVAEFRAPIARVWQVWADPRQLERWWGPPTWPATFTEHDLVVDGWSRYVMTGPDGEQMHGWWRFTGVDEPTGLAFEDGFADEQGQPAADMPVTRARVRLEEADAVTRMTMVSEFASTEQMQQLMDMGMAEGLAAALGQIDGLLAG